MADSPHPTAGLRVKQAALVGVGTVLAAVMVFLGLWQMSVFESQKANSTHARVNQPVVRWSGDQPRRGEVSRDYGRRVAVSGTYLPDTQVLVGTAWPLRVVTGLRTDSGETLTVIRGQVGEEDTVTPAPTGRVDLNGVLLASEAPDSATPAAGLPSTVMGSVRLEVLAQSWPQPMLPASLTLTDTAARSEGLTPTPPKLPEGDGGARNRGYALQWWAFAAFTLGMSIVFARTMGRRR